MSKHLISATLSAEAYELYQEWVKERKASKMISRCIIESFQDITAGEQIIQWRKQRLPHLIFAIIQRIPKEEWFKINVTDRASIWELAKGSGQWGVPDMSWDFRMPNEPHPIQELMGDEEE